MEKLNFYLIQRNGILTDPFFLNDSKEFQIHQESSPYSSSSCSSFAPESLGSLSRDAIKRATEAHCPVRGHDPG